MLEAWLYRPGSAKKPQEVFSRPLGRLAARRFMALGTMVALMDIELRVFSWHYPLHFDSKTVDPLK